MAISSSLVGIVVIVCIVVSIVGIVVGIMRRLAQGPGPPGILHCAGLHWDF